MLKKKIQAVSQQMTARLAEIRQTYTQSGDKGSRAEGIFRLFLREYLPRRLGVGHGEVVDSHGLRSGETDIVVATEDHPFTFTPDLPGLFFIEGVCAAAEVKMVLDKGELEKTIAHSRLFKDLRFSPGKGTLVNTQHSDLGRYYVSPPYFLVAFESTMTLASVENCLKNATTNDQCKINTVVDAIFLLDRGWLINFGTGDETFQFRDSDGRSIPGWVGRRSGSVLFKCLYWLSVVMPRMIWFEPVLLPYLNIHNPLEVKP